MSFTPINKPGSNYRCVWGTNRVREIDVTGFESLQNSGLRPFVIAVDQSSEKSAISLSSDTTPPHSPTSSLTSSLPICFTSPKKWRPGKFIDAKGAVEKDTQVVLRSKLQGKHGTKRIAKREHWSVSRRKRKICHEHNSKLQLSWFNNPVLMSQIEREKQAERKEEQGEQVEEQTEQQEKRAEQ